MNFIYYYTTLRKITSPLDRIKRRRRAKSLQKKQAAIKANAFIQNIHHFRDEYLKDEFNAPIEKVVVFDEAQRAGGV